jgi:cell division protein ZapE
MSPLQVYSNKLTQGEIQQDTLQNEVVMAFEDLYFNICQEKKYGLFKPQRKFYGLYIFGTVGRGKTFLMDLFVNCLDKNIVRRQHFHQFMSWLHQQLHAIKNQQNPVDLVIKNLSKDISVLCLDEFLVHDITDAMLLATILKALKKQGISLVTTSNLNPINLYEGGLQRQKFIPAIHWMQEQMQVMQLDGNLDYRIQASALDKKWFSPINDSNRKCFEQKFSQLVASHDVHLSPIEINKRPLNIIKRSSQHIMFEFETLCEQPRNASDYIRLCQDYQSIFIVINSPIANENNNTARRFITLVDVLYDANTPLYVLSTVSFDKIYSGNELAFEMQRTISRLTEMQKSMTDV